MPGLDAVAVRASRGMPGNRCDVGFVTDTQRRAWVVRVPTTSAVGAQLDTAADLLPLLHRRVPYSVPLPRGFLAVPEGRAVVYAYLHGRSVVLSEVVPGPGVAAEIGRADRGACTTWSGPSSTRPGSRSTTRRRAVRGTSRDLDRGAATGHVPTALLSRWERALEDVSAWRFAPTPVHARPHRGPVPRDVRRRARTRRPPRYGRSPGGSTPRSPTRRTTSRPSRRSALRRRSRASSRRTPLARIERPDRHLRHRAKVVSELRLLTRLLDAVHAAEPPLITRRAAELRVLDEQTANEPDLVVTEPAGRRIPGCRRRSVATTHGRCRAQGGADDVPEVREDDTQLLKTGTAADPPRSSPPRSSTGCAPSRLAAPSRRRRPADSESWYEVLEAAPAVDEAETAGTSSTRTRSDRGDARDEDLDERPRAGGTSRRSQPRAGGHRAESPSRAGGHRGLELVDGTEATDEVDEPSPNRQRTAEPSGRRTCRRQAGQSDQGRPVARRRTAAAAESA